MKFKDSKWEAVFDENSVLRLYPNQTPLQPISRADSVRLLNFLLKHLVEED